MTRAAALRMSSWQAKTKAVEVSAEDAFMAAAERLGRAMLHQQKRDIPAHDFLEAYIALRRAMFLPLAGRP